MEVYMDLCRDYDEMIREWMQTHGFQVRDTRTKRWYDFYNLQKKRIYPVPREVLFSREFSCPEEVREGLAQLVQKLRSGDDVSCYLSKKAREPAEFDSLLYDWGIYHFHLGTEQEEKSGFIRRTGPLLFARVDRTHVYCIQVYLHGGKEKPWSRQEMVRTIHRNWPETIAHWKVGGGIEIADDEAHSLGDQEHADCRRKGINTFVFAEPGTAYMPLGGGYSGCGASVEVVRYGDRVYNHLKRNEQYIQEHLTEIVEDLQRKSGIKLKEAEFHLIELDGSYYVMERHSMLATIRVVMP